MTKERFQDFKTVEEYIESIFGVCGCSEIKPICKTLVKILEWANADIDNRLRYDSLFDDVGIFYLLLGMCDQAGLIEHGVSIRHPWLTEEGKVLLSDLRSLIELEAQFT